MITKGSPAARASTAMRAYIEDDICMITVMTTNQIKKLEISFLDSHSKYKGMIANQIILLISSGNNSLTQEILEVED